MKLCDLHTHSIYSDGSWPVEQLLDEAERIGLSAIALTDHNTISGLGPFMAAAEGRSVEAVPGTEFSLDYRGTEIHMLGLFIRPEHYEIVAKTLEESQRLKVESNKDLVRKLNAAGYKLDYDRICSLTADGQFNRAHVAGELVRLGYMADRKEAFNKLLAQECGYYVPPKRMTAAEGVRFIKSLGAVAVLAHPLLTLKPEALHPLLEELVPLGLDAMETNYVNYDAETTQLACEIADAFGLKHSGGSDFHGDAKPDIRLGVGRGELAVPAELVDGLRSCAKLG